MKRIIVLSLSLAVSLSLLAQKNKTYSSLMFNADKVQRTEVTSETGNLYRELAHHGPAIENEWVAYRLYFDHKVSLDIYNKSKAQLELDKTGWYPSPDQEKKGFGSDQYKVGPTVGAGGVRLWDDGKEVFLNPIKLRTARVRTEANQSYMEMLSEGVAYRGDTIDVLVRVTVFSGKREAKVEAFAFSSKPVQFFTGLNFHKETIDGQGEKYLWTWGTHPEDIAAVSREIGAAVIFNPEDFEIVERDKIYYNMVSKPTNYIEIWVTSAVESENKINTAEKFVNYLNELTK